MYIIQIRSNNGEEWADDKSYKTREKAVEEIKKLNSYQYRLIYLVKKDEY